MKSLERVNERIAFIEASEWIKEESPYYYEKVVLEQLKELKQIKQDLERLELLEKTIEIIKKPKNKDGLYTAFYDGVGVNEQEEEILIKVIGNCEDDE